MHFYMCKLCHVPMHWSLQLKDWYCFSCEQTHKAKPEDMCPNPNGLTNTLSTN